MSLPEFPTISPALTREEAVNQIISSIAMEELALSHIINAEGEKIQYILGTLDGALEEKPTIEQVLEVNESVRSTLQAAAENQAILRSKLQNVLNSSVLVGPTGATGVTGATGPATVNVVEEVERLEPDQIPSVENLGDSANALLKFSIPRGVTGATGATGATGVNGFAATIAVNDVEIVPFNNAYVINVGTEDHALLNFGVPQGEPGIPGSRALTIPFCINKYGIDLSTDENGNPGEVVFCAFGSTYFANTPLLEGEWESGKIVIDGYRNFSASFIAPQDLILKKIHVVFTPSHEIMFEQGIKAYPFACIAISDSDNLVFNILKDTEALVGPLEGDIPYSRNQIFKGSSNNLSVAIPEGSLIAILVGLKSVNEPYMLEGTFCVSGGLYFM